MPSTSRRSVAGYIVAILLSMFSATRSAANDQSVVGRSIPVSDKKPFVVRPAVEFGGSRVEILDDSIRVDDGVISKSQFLMDANAFRLAPARPPAPAKWPANRAWRPLRHTGPFAISGIHLRVTGQGGTWYFGKYFHHHPDGQWFKKYWPSQTLPTNDIEMIDTLYQPQYVPGEMSNTPNALHDVLFALEEIRYSSKFGGTIALVLRSVEDFEYDLRGEEVLKTALATSNTVVKEFPAWDLSAIELIIYINPNPKAFNSNSAYPLLDRPLNVEINAKAKQRYKVRRTERAPGASGIGAPPETTVIVRDTDESGESLRAALTEAARALSLNPDAMMTREAQQFVHGWIHAEFQREIGHTNLVDMITVSDEFFQPFTRAGKPQFSVSMQVDRVNLNTEPGGEEIQVKIGSEQVFSPVSGQSHPRVIRVFNDIGNGEGTRSDIYASLLMEDCDHLSGIIVWVHVIEKDSFQDDQFETEFFSVPYPAIGGTVIGDGGVCADLSQRVANGQWGRVGNAVRQIGFLYKGSRVVNADGTVSYEDLQGTFGLTSGLILELR